MWVPRKLCEVSIHVKLDELAMVCCSGALDQIVVREERWMVVSDDCGSRSGGNSNDRKETAPNGGQPGDQQAEVVADGGEEGVDGVA